MSTKSEKGQNFAEIIWEKNLEIPQLKSIKLLKYIPKTVTDISNIFKEEPYTIIEISQVVWTSQHQTNLL